MGKLESGKTRPLTQGEVDELFGIKTVSAKGGSVSGGKGSRSKDQ